MSTPSRFFLSTPVAVIRSFIAQAFYAAGVTYRKLLLCCLLFVSCFILSLNAAAAGLTSGEPAPTLPPEKVSLQLIWKHQFEFAGFYAAIEKGFYRKRGLEVELREYEPGLDVSGDVITGKTTYGLSNSQVIADRLAGKPLKLLANYFKQSPVIIVAKPEIHSLEDLRGKRLMIDPKDLSSPLFYKAFQAAGLEPGVNIELIPHSYDPTSFINGEVDATTAFVTNELYAVENSGVPFSLIDVSGYLPALGDVYLFTSEQETRLHPQRARAFIEASNEGWQYALQHPEEIIDLILEQYSTRKTREALRYEADKTKQQMLPVAFPIGSVYHQRVEKVADTLVEQGVVADKQHLADFIWDGGPAENPAEKAAISLTPEEQEWLRQHPDIRIGSDADWMPYIWREKGGGYAGIETDLIARINALSGANIRFELGKWTDIVEQAGRGELYGLAVSARHKEREAQFLFSDSPYSTHKYIYTHKGSPVTKMTGLQGRRVGLLGGNLAEAKLLQRWPGLIPVEMNSPIELAIALQTGAVDAVLSGINLHLVVHENLVPDIQLAFLVPDSKVELLYSIHKNYPELHSIINKSLAAIKPGEMLSIFEKWGAERPMMMLTPGEQAYLSGTVFKRGEAYDWMPLSFKNEDGRIIGIVEDYWELIRNKLGLEETIAKTSSFAELLPAMQRGEVDIYAGTTRTEDREAYAVFSEHYEEHPIAIATRKNAGLISSAAVLEGKVVAVGKNYSAYHMLKARYPEIQFLQVSDTSEALARVISGEAYAAVDILPVIQFNIEHFATGNIKLAGVTDVQFPLQVMVARQHARLIPLINRAIAAITVEERARIHKKWMLREVVITRDYALLWLVLGIGMSLLALVLFWNQRLYSEIRGRKQAERALHKSEAELLQAKEEAEAANEEKSQFLTNMSHEMRTPLNALIGVGYLMRKTELTAKQSDYLDMVQVSSRTLLGVIDDVLDFSKIESGKLSLDSVVFCPDDVLKQLSCVIEEQARQKGLEFHVEVGDDVPECLLGDPQRLSQILLNLADNAVKFTEQGAVNIYVSLLTQTRQHSCLRFSVTDTGPGISEAHQQKLFKRFSQVDSSLTRLYRGSGLGLAISQSLAQLMGGLIELDSQPGQGSTFTLTVDFPVCTRGAGRQAELTPEAVVSASVHVLLVEDDALNQLLARELLEMMGATVTVADNGSVALEKLRQTHFSLVFMDLQMPVMDGYEAVRHIRRQPEWDYLPVIAMTAHAVADERDKCLSAGMNDYLPKPFELEQFSHMLSKWSVRRATDN